MGWFKRLFLVNFIIWGGALVTDAAWLSAGFGRAAAQDAQAEQPAAPVYPPIRQITVVGNERVEPETIASYLAVRAGDPFDPALLDRSLKNLFATGLFSDVELSERGGVLIIRVVENPIINRIVFEGNKRLDRDELLEEVRLRPRMVFTRAKVRADVQRMLELYRRSGRFAAIIEPKVVEQAQNRVDLVFEVQEGPKTKVSRINFIGNKRYSDGDLRDVLATKESRWWKLFTSNDTFDPDRLAYDQQVLRQYYLNEGYADFRVVSAVSELTPDREDFFITFTVEEGEIYSFGKVDVESEIRDVNEDLFRAFLLMREGMTYNAEAIERTIEALTNAAGLLGYAFVDVRPRLNRDRETRTIDITFNILDAPRVYVERINIHGNVRTLDRVIRREFRLQEGDAFNSALVTRSENRLNRLNFFREVQVEQQRGSLPDRMVLDVRVEEQATGQLNVGAGFSSLENFIFDVNIQEQNLLGRGQRLNLGLRLSGARQDITLGFTEPYLGGRAVAGGIDVFRTRFDDSLFDNGFTQDRIGFSLRAGMAISEYWTLSTRYTLRQDDVQLTNRGLENFIVNTLASFQQFQGESDEDFLERIADVDVDGDGDVDRGDLDTNNSGAVDFDEIAPFVNRITAETIGNRIQSILGYTVGFDTRNNLFRPTRGTSFFFSQDFAGLGGDVTYLRNRINFDHYWTPFAGWTLRLGGEAGFIEGIGQNVLTNDKFFIGGPRIRGFDNAGIGPRDLSRGRQGGALGGTAFYIGRTELFFPLGEAALELGINASIFADVGSLWRSQIGQDEIPQCDLSLDQFDLWVQTGETGGANFNCLAGDSQAPRVAVGIGFSWQSPFGPFRIDLTRALRRQVGDDTQSLQFNVGTAF